MTKYIAKPSIHNNNGLKEFDNAADAITYLNEKLSDRGISNYIFIEPKTNRKNLKRSIEEYCGIGKLFVTE